MEELRLAFLGAPALLRNGAPVKIKLRKALALLALLGVTLRPHSREALSELLFPRQVRGRGRAGVRQCLSVLRSELGSEWVLCDDEMVSLAISPALWVDTKELRELETAFADPNRPAGLAEKRKTLERIEQLFRGAFLAGFSLKDATEFDLWQTTFRESLRIDHLRNLQRLTALDLGTGEYEVAIRSARRLLAIEPTDETGHRALMTCYALLGRRGEALRQFEKCRSVVGEELGVEPEQETQDLRLRIVQGELRRPEVQPERPAASTAPPTNLRQQPTPFMGRERELKSVEEMLHRSGIKLITITGTAGTGKTRLALEAARRLTMDFPDGVFFHDLSPLPTADLVLSSLAVPLGLSTAPGYGSSPFDLVCSFLKEKKVLLVMDNFEHVLSAAGSVARLLAECAELTILATSRELLHIQAENEFQLQPFALPSPSDQLAAIQSNESVRFFVERAKASHYGFTLTENNASSIAALCVRLDGLPLALELAAAQVGALPPEKLLSLLQSEGSGVLAGALRDMPDRHQTLKGAIEWSHDLADPLEKSIFRRLAVFVDGCTLDSAEIVCRLDKSDDVLAAIRGLVDKNLVSRVIRGADMRYRMLETIRDFAAHRLEESSEANKIHRNLARYYLRLTEEAEPEMDRPDGPLWAERLEQEIGNIRTAVEWSIENDVETALRIGAALERFSNTHSYFDDNRRLLERALTAAEKLDDPKLDRARAKSLAALAALTLGPPDAPRSTSVAEKSIAAWRKTGEVQGLAHALLIQALARMYNASDPEAILAILREAMALQRSAGDRMGLAHTLFWYAYVVFCAGRHDEARRLAEDDLQISREAGDVSRVGASIGLLGQIAADEGDYEAAQSHLDRSLAIYRDTRDRPGLFHQLSSLASLAILRGSYEQVTTYYEEAHRRGCAPTGPVREMIAMCDGYVHLHTNLLDSALRSFQSVIERLQGEDCSWARQCIAFSLAGVAAVEGRTGHPARAAELFGGAAAIVRVPYPRLAWGWHVGVTQTMLRVQVDAIEETVRGANGAAFVEQAAAGRALPFAQLIGMGLSTWLVSE